MYRSRGGLRRRRLEIVGCICLALVLTGAERTYAQQVTADTAGAHIVRPGDTLWDLARQYLNDPFRWPEIHSLNREVVRDPHWIYPRERLLIPGRSGTVIPPMGVTPELPSFDGRTVFFGEGPGTVDPNTVRMTPPEEIAPVELGAFYSAALLVPESAMSPVGELVGVVSPTVVPRRGTPQIHPYDRVLLRLSGSVEVGDRIQLMRAERAVRPYGRIFLATGTATVLEVQGSVATIEVDQLFDRVEPGDVALPFPAFEARPGVAAEPAGGLQGRLLAFVEPQPIAATGDIAFVDLGSASGVVEGDEFIAVIPAEAESWGVRPEVEVARLQVVRAGQVTSAVRVVSLQHPALEAGLPVRLVARMPAGN